MAELIIAGYHGDERHWCSERDEATRPRKAHRRQLNTHLMRHPGPGGSYAAACQKDEQAGKPRMLVVLLESYHRMFLGWKGALEVI